MSLVYPINRWALLTPWEFRVACLAMQGMRSDKIAVRLKMSKYVTKNHLSSAYGKLRVRNQVELVMLNHPEYVAALRQKENHDQPR